MSDAKSLLAQITGNINLKKAFVAGQEVQQAQQAQQQMDPEQAQAMAEQGMDPAQAQAMMAQQGQEQPVDPSQDPNAQPQQPGQAPEEAMAGAGEEQAAQEYDMLVSAVRQVMQEMGVQPGAPQEQAAQPAQKRPKSGGGGKVDAEQFAQLQAAVATLLEHLGLVDQAEVLSEVATAQPVEEEVPAEEPAADASNTMGANPGSGAELPPDAEEVGAMGPLDPAAAQAMAGIAGKQAGIFDGMPESTPAAEAATPGDGSRVSKLASLLKGKS